MCFRISVPRAPCPVPRAPHPAPRAPCPASRAPCPVPRAPQYNASMKIALGADHAGYELKNRIKVWLAQQGHQPLDEGTNAPDSVDYPDYARKVAESVVRRESDFGILVCGSGIGMAIAANKVPGIRAANVTTENEAALSREHNNANVLTLGARILKDDDARRIVDKWLHTQFAGGRHQQRVDKITAIEREEKLTADQRG